MLHSAHTPPPPPGLQHSEHCHIEFPDAIVDTMQYTLISSYLHENISLYQHYDCTADNMILIIYWTVPNIVQVAYEYRSVFILHRIFFIIYLILCQWPYQHALYCYYYLPILQCPRFCINKHDALLINIINSITMDISIPLCKKIQLNTENAKTANRTNKIYIQNACNAL